MRKGPMNRKRGFTLVETVVAVGIVAALAAVVYPAVVKQFESADPTRLQQDLSNIAVGIETFNVNNRAMPGDLDDLANQISTTAGATDSTLLPATTATEFSVINLWRGPYISATISDDSDTDHLLPTGFGANIVDSFVCYDSFDNEHGVSQATAATATANDVSCPSAPTQGFLAIQIVGIACSTTAGSTFMQINELFDGTNEVAGAEGITGRIRCTTTGGSKTTDVNVVYFLAVPIS